MAFIEKQRHGKHDYFYLVKSVRLSPTKVSKVRVFLGRKVPGHDELQKYFSELERKAPKPYEAKWLSQEAEDRLEDLHSAVVAFKGFPEGMVPSDFLVRFTYNTNAIEGNPLTLRQTALILSEGIAPQGVKTNDVIEVLNGKDAWEFVKSYKGQVNKEFACKIQFEITKNTTCRIQGDYRDSEVGIGGSDWKPPAAKDVPRLMGELFKEYQKNKRALHPVELASWLHNGFVQIHPFTDGNGRTSRLLMNWILMRNRFPPAIIETRNKEQYYNAIEEADKGNQKPFASFLSQQLLEQYTILKPEEQAENGHDKRA
jgi:Fic family protein